MELTIGFILGIIGGLITNYISPPFKRVVEGILNHFFLLFNPVRFDLTGTWEQTFTEPTSDTTTWEEVKERVTLRHFGGSVSGQGITHDNGRVFVYDLRVQHNMVFGSYQKTAAKGNITGKGVIQMIVSPDRLSMKGQATWFDHDTERIESSECVWSKVSSGLEPIHLSHTETPQKLVTSSKN